VEIILDQEKHVVNIFKIQRFSLHDGPGIRTTVFFQGCPLRCGWCSNPEGQLKKTRIFYYESLCIHCGKCISVCPNKAIGPAFETIQARCVGCGECASVCYTGARQVSGTPMTVQDVVEICLADSMFYFHSGGGVTLSGGEPVMFSEFSCDLLKELKAHNISTAFETCGYVDETDFIHLAKESDLVLFDLKTIDESASISMLGQDLKKTIQNLTSLFELKKRVRIRFAVIPGFNDTEEQVNEYATYLAPYSDKFEQVEILPFHRLGGGKYQALGMSYEYQDVVEYSDKELSEITGIFRDRGINAVVMS
jgi:pyruvate formate lyase activating enzyme